MGSPGQATGRESTRAVSAVLVKFILKGFCLAMLGLMVAGAGSGQEEDPESGPEIAEPLFALLVRLAQDDSLGSWTGAQIREMALAQGRPSRFPLEMIESVERRRPREEERRSWPHAAVNAVWRLNLQEGLDRPMPYSILGYHPGSLRISKSFILTETRQKTLALRLGTEMGQARDVFLFRLDQGHIILDVDGLVDRLLGKGLDDSGTVGFVLAREEEKLVGLAISLGRKGRRIYGEFDFQQDQVLPNGRPFARALSYNCRQRMLDGYTGPPLGAWVE